MRNSRIYYKTYYQKLADGRVIQGRFAVGDEYKLGTNFTLWFRKYYDDDDSMSRAVYLSNSGDDIEEEFRNVEEAKALATQGLELIKDVEIPDFTNYK